MVWAGLSVARTGVTWTAARTFSATCVVDAHTHFVGGFGEQTKAILKPLNLLLTSTEHLKSVSGEKAWET